MFVLRFPTMKLFKIKAFKTYVSYITTCDIYVSYVRKHKRKWRLHKMLYNICLKVGIFEVKLYYINFMRLFLLRKSRNLETQRINCNVKEVR